MHSCSSILAIFFLSTPSHFIWISQNLAYMHNYDVLKMFLWLKYWSPHVLKSARKFPLVKSLIKWMISALHHEWNIGLCFLGFLFWVFFKCEIWVASRSSSLTSKVYNPTQTAQTGPVTLLFLFSVGSLHCSKENLLYHLKLVNLNQPSSCLLMFASVQTWILM